MGVLPRPAEYSRRSGRDPVDQEPRTATSVVAFEEPVGPVTVRVTVYVPGSRYA